MVMVLINHKGLLQEIQSPFIISLLEIEEPHALEVFEGSICPKSQLQTIKYLLHIT